MRWAIVLERTDWIQRPSILLWLRCAGVLSSSVKVTLPVMIAPLCRWSSRQVSISPGFLGQQRKDAPELPTGFSAMSERPVGSFEPDQFLKEAIASFSLE
jgi:hypothetical protein